MATVSAALMERLDKVGIPKSKRKLQKHLRSAGLAYISRTGKLIPAKRVADELCQCPQKCDERVPMEARQCLFYHFYGLGEADLQNEFLRNNMDLRARLNVPEATGSGRPPRRITCKYLVPLLPSDAKMEVCQKAFVSAFVITTKRVRLQREKLITSLGLNSYSSHNRTASSSAPKPISAADIQNNNVTTVARSQKKRLNASLLAAYQKYAVKSPAHSPPLQPKSLVIDDDPMEEGVDDSEDDDVVVVSNRRTTNHHSRMSIDNPLIPIGLLVPDGVTIAPVTATPDHDRDIAIVHNFFSNQLWKPEYIGAYS